MRRDNYLAFGVVRFVIAFVIVFVIAFAIAFVMQCKFVSVLFHGW